MNLPPAAFMAPDGGNRAAVEALLGRTLDLVLSRAAEAGIRAPLPEQEELPEGPLIPEAPRDEGALLGALDQLLRGAMNPANPGYLGHMDPLPATGSLVGALAAASANNNLLSLEMSPQLSRLEAALMAELGRLFGLPDRCGGVMTSGGSLANLLALTVARNRALGCAEPGLAGCDRRPVVFASEAAHTSIQKAAMVLGLGSAAVRPVACDGAARMAPRALASALKESRAAGELPIAVVATAGTTVTGSLDPLAPIAEIAAGEGLWLHVDAAYGGAMILSAQARPRLAGIERADSITFNPQKWLYVAKTCACCLLRERADLTRHFRIAAPYMSDDDSFVNLGELGLQGTRAGEVLKLWATLQHLGVSGLGGLIERSLALTQVALAEITRRPTLELAAGPECNLLCFRARGDDLLNQSLQRALMKAGWFLSLPQFRGRRWLRLVLLNPFTGAQDLTRLFGDIDQLLETLAR